MGLFDRKYCDICGNKIGMLGNRKLEDGNCCKDCAKKLSPFFDERRHSTVAQIKEQLAYREANQPAVDAFRTSRTFGEGYTMLHVDESACKFLVAGSNFTGENPDVLDFSQVTSVSPDIRESRHELKQKDAQGKEVSFNPPRFEYEYDFHIVIRVNHPWFTEMRFKLNRNTLTIQELGAVRSGIFTRQTSFDPHMSRDYQRYENMIQEIADCLQSRGAASCAPPATGGLRLEAQAVSASLAGNRDQAIALYKQAIMQGGGEYTPLLLEMRQKVMEPASTIQDAQELLDWANQAKAAGQDADAYISFANATLTARKMGVGADAPLEQQYAAAITAAQQEAMAKTAPVDKEKLIAEFRSDPAKAAQARALMGAAAFDALMGRAPAAPAGPWTCICGATNTGKFCEYCGSPRP